VANPPEPNILHGGPRAEVAEVTPAGYRRFAVALVLAEGQILPYQTARGGEGSSARTRQGSINPLAHDMNTKRSAGNLIIDAAGLTFKARRRGLQVFWDFCELLSWQLVGGTKPKFLVNVDRGQDQVETFTFDVHQSEGAAILKGVAAYVNVCLSSSLFSLCARLLCVASACHQYGFAGHREGAGGGGDCLGGEQNQSGPLAVGPYTSLSHDQPLLPIPS
jgi:hypothetical protein